MRYEIFNKYIIDNLDFYRIIVFKIGRNADMVIGFSIFSRGIIGRSYLSNNQEIFKMKIGKCSVCGYERVPLGIDDRCDRCAVRGEQEPKKTKDNLKEYLIDYYNNNSLDEETEVLVLNFLEKELNVDITMI